MPSGIATAMFIAIAEYARDGAAGAIAKPINARIAKSQVVGDIRFIRKLWHDCDWMHSQLAVNQRPILSYERSGLRSCKRGGGVVAIISKHRNLHPVGAIAEATQGMVNQCAPDAVSSPHPQRVGEWSLQDVAFFALLRPSPAVRQSAA